MQPFSEYTVSKLMRRLSEQSCIASLWKDHGNDIATHIWRHRKSGLEFVHMRNRKSEAMPPRPLPLPTSAHPETSPCSPCLHFQQEGKFRIPNLASCRAPPEIPVYKSTLKRQENSHRAHIHTHMQTHNAFVVFTKNQGLVPKKKKQQSEFCWLFIINML